MSERKINSKVLTQYLIDTEQMFPLMMELGGLDEGIGKDHSQPCPVCGGDDRFWHSVDNGWCYCRKCEKVYSIFDLIMHHHGIDFVEAKKMIVTKLDSFDGTIYISAKAKVAGRESNTLKRTGKKSKQFRKGTTKKTEYLYLDGNRDAWQKVVRIDGINESTGKPDKTFSQWKFDNGWIPGAPDNTIPYRLNDVLQADTVFIVEGEKTADCLNQVLQVVGIKDVAATTSPMGAKNGSLWIGFVKQYPAILTKRIIILPDNDEPGMNYARTVASAILKANPSMDAKIVKLPDLSEGEDFVDWCAGKNESVAIEKLFELCEQAERVDPNIEPAPKREKIIVRFIDPSTYDVKPTEWAWDNKFPYGDLSLLLGMPKEGKSTFTAYMAARISRGGEWCDGTPCEQGSVAFFAGEDKPDVLIERLLANGADLTKIRIIDGAELTGDKKREEIDITLARRDVIFAAIKQLEKATGTPCRMVVVDPMTNWWGDKVNENSNKEVRSVLFPLLQFFQKHRIVPLLVAHPRKGQDIKAQTRIAGSRAIAAVVRNMWGIYTDPKDPTAKSSEKKRFLVHVGGNAGYDQTGIVFSIVPQGKVHILDVGIEKTGDDFEVEWQQASMPKGRPPRQLNDCLVHLADFLKNGPKPALDVLEFLKAEGFGKSTIIKAKKELGIESFREDKNDSWLWRFLPVSGLISGFENSE